MGLTEVLLAVTRDVQEGGVDRPEVGVLVGGRSRGSVRLSAWRFTGFVNPEVHAVGAGERLLTMQSPWAETRDDVRQSLSWARSNASRMRSVVGRKRRRFGLGRSWYSHPERDVSEWLRKLPDAGVELSGSYINLGANDGVGDDPLYRFAMDTHAAGSPVGFQLAVEMDPELCRRHRENLPWVQLRCDRISPQNTRSLLAPAFTSSASARHALDVLKVDIDSFEAFVLEECLGRIGLAPKLIFVEVNAGIPPPLQYALHDSPQLREAYTRVELTMGADGYPLEVNMPIAGVSLSYLVRRLAPEYLLLELGSPDAVFARADILERLGRKPLDEFQAFERSWVDVHGFSRQQVRRWYFELDEVAALGEVHDYLLEWMRSHLGVALPFVLSY